MWWQAMTRHCRMQNSHMGAIHKHGGGEDADDWPAGIILLNS